ncbi:MAG: FAD-dependent oxidoreductase [Planctomycetota bacterium]
MSDNQPHYFRPQWITPTDERLDVDVCVYGGTAAGVIAAATASAAGMSVALLNPATTLGGMTTGGLGRTDAGDKSAIDDAALKFYRAIGGEYGTDEVWNFEPGVAQRVIDRYAKESGATIRPCQFLHAADLDADGRINEVVMLGGLRCRARMFLDCTYEGDLMAAAGVPYVVGRESNATFGETLNGAHVGPKHQFPRPVDPFITPGVPHAGLLPGIESRADTPVGTGDHHVQAYNFRLCLTDDPDLRVDIDPPAGYDRQHYELAARWLATSEPGDLNYPLWLEDNAGRGLVKGEPRRFDRLHAHHKTDTNNHGAVSTDFVGGGDAWPEGDYAQREAIFQRHVAYTRGLLHFFQTNPAVPDVFRREYARWGLAGDEFTDTGHWPHQLYIREARRMRGDYVLTEHDIRGDRKCDDPVALGSYQMDSHNCRRVLRLDPQPHVINEGDVQHPAAGPYPISRRCITPPAGSCPNLLVPVCVSASHIAFGSVRMEPVFIQLGAAAARIAAETIRA